MLALSWYKKEIKWILSPINTLNRGKFSLSCSSINSGYKDYVLIGIYLFMTEFFITLIFEIYFFELSAYIRVKPFLNTT